MSGRLLACLLACLVGSACTELPPGTLPLLLQMKKQPIEFDENNSSSVTDTHCQTTDRKDVIIEDCHMETTRSAKSRSGQE